MHPLAQFLRPGRPLTVQLLAGPPVTGVLQRATEQWLVLATPGGQALVNLDHAMAVHLAPGPEDAEPVDAPLPRPTSKEAPIRAGSRAPGRPWQDADLKALSEGFLDGADDAALSERFHRTRGQIRELRHGFECARGNLVEDEVSPIAATWAPRWRRVLAAK